MDNSSLNSYEFYLRTSFLSGAASSIGLFPHLLFLAFLFFTQRPAPLAFLIPTYLGSLVLSEYIFWGILKNRTTTKFTPKQLFRLKEKNYFGAAYFSEFLFDTILLLTALKAGWNPLNFYMILGCRFLSAPFQVLLYKLLPLKKRKLHTGNCSPTVYSVHYSAVRSHSVCCHHERVVMQRDFPCEGTVC